MTHLHPPSAMPLFTISQGACAPELWVGYDGVTCCDYAALAQVDVEEYVSTCEGFCSLQGLACVGGMKTRTRSAGSGPPCRCAVTASRIPLTQCADALSYPRPRFHRGPRCHPHPRRHPRSCCCPCPHLLPLCNCSWLSLMGPLRSPHRPPRRHCLPRCWLPNCHLHHHRHLSLSATFLVVWGTC